LKGKTCAHGEPLRGHLTCKKGTRGLTKGFWNSGREGRHNDSDNPCCRERNEAIPGSRKRWEGTDIGEKGYSCKKGE